METDLEPRAVTAQYDAVTATVTIRLANGCAFLFPVNRFPELATGTPEQLATVQVDLDGEALVWNEPNFCVSVPGLIMAAVGNWDRWAADQARRKDNARKGGQSKAPARAEASRTNGRKGGRPRKEKSA